MAPGRSATNPCFSAGTPCAALAAPAWPQRRGHVRPYPVGGPLDANKSMCAPTPSVAPLVPGFNLLGLPQSALHHHPVVDCLNLPCGTIPWWATSICPAAPSRGGLLQQPKLALPPHGRCAGVCCTQAHGGRHAARRWKPAGCWRGGRAGRGRGRPDHLWRYRVLWGLCGGLCGSGGWCRRCVRTCVCVNVRVHMCARSCVCMRTRI